MSRENKLINFIEIQVRIHCPGRQDRGFSVAIDSTDEHGDESLINQLAYKIKREVHEIQQERRAAKNEEHTRYINWRDRFTKPTVGPEVDGG